MFEDLRRSPVYQQALRTEDVLSLPPVRTVGFWNRRTPLADDMRVLQAGKRLDHQIRRILGPGLSERDVADAAPYRLSAMKFFIEVIEQIWPSLQPDTKARMGPRLDICREIIARADKYLGNGSRVSVDGFRHLAITHGFEPEWLVLDNPLCRVEFVTDPWATDQEKKASRLRAILRDWYWS
jgi:hypothetical protein